MKKVQFGCGSNFLSGWINHDFEVDITKPLPYENDSVDFIFAEHTMEHITPKQAYDFLCECYRILKKGGVIRITVPSIVKLMSDFNEDYGKFFKEHNHSDGTKRGSILNIAFGNGHQSVWDDEILETFFWLAGFENNKKVEIGKSEFPELNNIESHWKIVGHNVNNTESISREGIK